MNNENDFGELYRPNRTEEMIDNFIEECEVEAAKLEITVDYYLAEFI
tara:strand:+ start:128 stop:268 length:141 start_codon:yes stop_codon:yes gene_type:complete